MGRAWVVIASCLWLGAFLTPSWAAGRGEAQQGGDFVHRDFSQPYPFLLSEERGLFCLYEPNGFARGSTASLLFDCSG